MTIAICQYGGPATGEYRFTVFSDTVAIGSGAAEGGGIAKSVEDEPIFLSQSELLQLADRCPPPQRWYDEDFTGLF
jgi:hypothetical protein